MHQGWARVAPLDELRTPLVDEIAPSSVPDLASGVLDVTHSSCISKLHWIDLVQLSSRQRERFQHILSQGGIDKHVDIPGGGYLVT
jgi:hypothetical protein